MRQRWRDLLFAHWPAPAGALQALVPRPLQIQEFAGTSWVGLVPFQVEGLSARGAPDIPGLSSFPELNLRLYVEAAGKPGIWFISLDAASGAAVAGARAAFGLPYFRAAMTLARVSGGVHFSSVRRRDDRVHFAGTYRPHGPIFEAQPGTLEYFLIERYCLYTEYRRGEVRRLDVQHPPWRLQLATAEITSNTVAEAQGVACDGSVAPLLHFAARQDVVGWWPGKI
jgi:uncharacterized protein YqjF (DUF2071 family)